MLGFEIGQRESGFYSKQKSQNHGITEPSSTVLLYIYNRDKSSEVVTLRNVIDRIANVGENVRNDYTEHVGCGT